MKMTAIPLSLSLLLLAGTGAGAATEPADKPVLVMSVLPVTVRALQGRLEMCGDDPGRVDGVWGPQTEEALVQYQRRKGLPATGLINKETLAAFELEAPGFYVVSTKSRMPAPRPGNERAERAPASQESSEARMKDQPKQDVPSAKSAGAKGQDKVIIVEPGAR